MNREVLKIIPALINNAPKSVKCFVILLLVAGFLSCDKQSSSVEPEDDLEFCSCFDSFENINKTIPVVNEFLASLPDETRLNGGWTHKEQIFKSLVTWFKSLPCIIDASILYSDAAVYPPEMGGITFSVKDNNTVKELYLDFAIIDHVVTYSQIAGYYYAKQDAIHVATRLIKIDKVFDFVNSLDFCVKEIQGGTYFSNMPSNTDNLQTIVNGLKEKPYTNNSWVIGNLNGFNNQIILYIRLYEMHNRNYQEDWFKSMKEYQLVEDDFASQLEVLDEGYIYGPGHIIVFDIPEGTGKHWETKFKEYNFVRWTEMSHSRCDIRYIQ